MKEAKRVCPLESVEATAITQVIWPKLRLPAWFFYDLTLRQQEMERGLIRKQSAITSILWLFQGQSLSLLARPDPETSNASCLFKIPSYF